MVALIRSSGKTVGQVSRDLGLTETSVREWVQKAEIEEGKRPGLTAAEREELVRLRRQVRVLALPTSLTRPGPPPITHR